MVIRVNYEAVLMTFHIESDEAIARKSLDKANLMIKEINKSQVRKEADLRLIMKLYLDAFWVFKEIRVNLSHTIHQIGMTLEQEFECQYYFDEENRKYYNSCPAILLHYDFGFSLRGSEKYKCSICGLPIVECEHITGDFYDDVVCEKIDEICNICGKEECSEHIEGRFYNHVEAVKIVYDLNIITFDRVEDPEMKFARVGKIIYEKDEILNGLSENEKKSFIYGDSILDCHHCSQCKGYIPDRYNRLFNK